MVVTPLKPPTSATAKPMLKPLFTMKGWLSVHVVALPPSQTDAAFQSVRTLPVEASHAATGWLT
jgi:hypothetical protein